MLSRKFYLSPILAIAAVPTVNAGNETYERPNILWLTFEDTSYYELGCYGNESACTPVIDSLASAGIRFTNAYSCGPQSSPSRSTLITGCYSTTYAMDWHRNRVVTPDNILFPQYLREAGYFCTNNQKTDYNTRTDNSICWDECGSTATYNSPGRKPGQPFFAVFNSSQTHMSRLTSVHLDGRRDFAAEGIDPEKLDLPPHVPDIPEIRSDYAFHIEGVNDVDKWVGIFLDDLKMRGLDKNTIIFVFSDHGGCLPRGKAFCYETSFRVPMVLYLPPAWEHLSKMKTGEPSDRLVSFADMASTVLSAAGIEPPAYMQGLPFLGKYDNKERQWQIGYMTNRSLHYIPSRSISDGHFKYIRYYIPYKKDALFNYFQWEMPANLYWDRAYFAGQCSGAALRPYEYSPAESFYDLSEDPFELNDLAGNPEYAGKMERFRKALSRHIRKTKDIGFLPVTARTGKEAPYDMVRKPGYDLELLYRLAEMTATVSEKDIPYLKSILSSGLGKEFKYWATVNMSVLARRHELKDGMEELKQVMYGSDYLAAQEAAYALCHTDERETAFAFMAKTPQTVPALEVLSLEPDMKKAFPDFLIDSLEKVSMRYEAIKRRKMPNAHDGIGERKVLVNLGLMDAKDMYGPGVYETGLKINKMIRPAKPLPNFVIPVRYSGEKQSNGITEPEYTSDKGICYNTSKAEIMVFMPNTPKPASGYPCILILPGGGYGNIHIRDAGVKAAQFYNSTGLAAVVVKYRLPEGNCMIPITDGQQAMRMVRQHAEDWGLDQNKIGLTGSSAGGHLASMIAVHTINADPDSGDELEHYTTRPDFLILVKAVIDSSNGSTMRNIQGENPSDETIKYCNALNYIDNSLMPTFIAHCSDDPAAPVNGVIKYYNGLRESGVPAEMHIFRTGRHGMGYIDRGKPMDFWKKSVVSWLKGMKIN